MSPAETVASIASYLGRFADLQAADIERFAAKGRTRALEPGDSFCHLGQEKHEVAFIQTGIVRYLVILPDGDESTKDFSFKGSFTLSFGSAALNRPSAVAIEAVVRTQLLVWPYQVLLDLNDSSREWQRLAAVSRSFFMCARSSANCHFSCSTPKRATGRCARSSAQRLTPSRNIFSHRILACGRSPCRGSKNRSPINIGE
jgi:CRP-like cAMP-binding protein